MERNELPLFIKFYEKKGEPTDKLIDQLRNTAREFDVISTTTLENITEDPENVAQNILVYSITYDINNKREGEVALQFLKHVFKTYYDNFPAYVEPI